MAEQQNDENEIDYFHPTQMNTLAMPQEHDLLLAYEVYRPSLETLTLKSEQGRTVFAEYFIENIKLGPLRDLCTRALAKIYTPEQLPQLLEDPLQLRLYYDALSLDLPLEKCYHITDDKYWRRFVLAKNKDVNLAFKKEYDWRGLALSMKFVELVEACPPEYWPEDEMQPAAMLIKDHITQMHIRHLQSMSEHFFRDRLHLDSDGSDSDSTDVESMTVTPRSTELESIGQSVEHEEQQQEAEIMVKTSNVKIGATATPITDDPLVEETVSVPEITKTEKELEWERNYRDITAERKEQTRKLKDEQQRRRAERSAKRPRSSAVSQTLTRAEEDPPKMDKKEEKVVPKGVIDMEVEKPEDDEESFIVVRRSMERLLNAKKLLTYPTRLCHHVNLRFLRFFKKLTNLSIEFRGPIMGRDFHERHLRFSHADIRGLAFGISFLQNLQIFRLRSSRMDAQKLYTLTKSLKCLRSIEVIDFGYDHLDEECGLGLYELFRHTTSIKSLELEHNCIGERAMHFLAIGISYYGGQLEYLGLGGNPLCANGLHELSSRIVGTQQITHLCLRSAHLTETAIKCCIANELLKHAPLKSLDVRTVPISQAAGVEMLKVLQSNQTIMHLDVRDCNLAQELELDVAVILKRNKYIVANPYLNDPTKTQEEIEEYVARVKNPILLRAMHIVQKNAECLKSRPTEFPRNVELLRSSLLHEQSTFNEDEHAKSVTSLYKLIPKEKSIVDRESVVSHKSSAFSTPPTPPFKYDTSQFTEKEFLEHAYLPGPSERYYYFNTSQKQRIDKIS